MITLPWLEAQIPEYGRFASVAAPWLRCGFNVLPILPGAKSPAVAGWGKPGPGDALHSPDSPKLGPDAIATWCAQFRNLNVAVLYGSGNATCIDVDDPSKLDAVLAICGNTPFRVYSGREGGGIHLLYRGATRSRNRITSGVDLKSSGGYALAPGSIHHKTSREYSASPELVDALWRGVLELPAPREHWRRGLERMGTTLINPTRTDLHAYADRLRARDQTRTWGKCLRQVADGHSFAEPGERDSVLYRLLVLLADEWPHADTDAIVTLFGPSAAEMERVAGVEIPILDAVESKWERITANREERDDAADVGTSARRRTAWSWVGVDSDTTADATEAPICVHHGRSFYLRVGEQWVGPLHRDGITVDVLAALGALYGVALDEVSTLLTSHGRRLSSVAGSLAARETSYDPATNVLTVAAAPIRADLQPVRSEAVERLIANLGGQYATELTLWIAGLLRTDVPCRALVLSGPKHTGKSLLLAGLGRIWPRGYVKLADVLGKRFNSQLTASALAVADDDEASKSADTGEALATFLRTAVQDRWQRLERKGHDVESVEGCMRYAIATNDPAELVRGAVSFNLNDESLDAFGDRLLHIPVREGRHWEGIGATPDDLVAGDMIARHALWLAEIARSEPPRDRFWVGGGDTSLARLAVLSSGLRAELLVRIGLELQNPNVNTDPDKLGRGAWIAVVPDKVSCGVVVQPSRVLVHGPSMLAAWSFEAPRGTTIRSLGLALTAVSEGQERPPSSSAARLRYHAIRLDLIAWYMARCGL